MMTILLIKKNFRYAGCEFDLEYFERGKITNDINTKRNSLLNSFCELAGTRTQDPYIKSVLLYQLSYQFILFF